MDPISIAGTLIAVVQLTSKLISICYEYRSGVKSAVREIIQVRDQLNSLKAVLESLLRIVENADGDGHANTSSNTRAVARSDKNNEAREGLNRDERGSSRLATFEFLIKEGGPLRACQEELERLFSKLEPDAGSDRGWRKVKSVLVWPLKDGEVTKTLDGLERMKSTMLLALSTDQATLSLSIKDGVEDLTDMVQRHNLGQEQQSIHRWLAGPDASANLAANKKKRLQNTGIWLLKSKPYENWLHGPRSLLWLYGIPGSGKSVLCTTAIEHLLRLSHDMPGAVVGYYYFDFNDTSKRDVDSVIRCLVKQLMAYCNSVPDYILKLYQDHGYGSKRVEGPALLDVLRNLLLTFHIVYLAFDALDESSDCDEVLEFLHQIRSWELDRVHIVVTSRPIQAIEDSLAEVVTDKICLHETELNKDIILFIADKLENDKKLARWPPEIRLQIQQKLLDEEDGMFQWVVCQFDMLQRCMSVNAIRKAMSTLTKSLDETCERLLQEIDEFNQPEVMKILKALTVTENHLTSEEIVEILATDIDADPPRFDADSRLLDPRNILSMCSSLVTISNETRKLQGSFGLEALSEYSRANVLGLEPILRLAHASVADFLTRSEVSRLSHFHFSEYEARQFMAQSCLTYLLNPEFSKGDNIQDREHLGGMLRRYPLLRHCVNSWPLYLKRHAGDPEDHLNPRTKEIMRMFFATCKLPNGGNFACWVRLLIPDSPAQHVQNTAPLYYAASFGLLEVVRILLDTEGESNINALGGRAHTTALHASVYRDHLEVARLLLERGADPNIRNITDEPPIIFAHWNKNIEMQGLLLRHGADSVRSYLSEMYGDGARSTDTLSEESFVSESE